MKLKEVLCIALLCFPFTISGCSTVGPEEINNSENLVTEKTEPNHGQDNSSPESESSSGGSTEDNLPETESDSGSQTKPASDSAQEDSSTQESLKDSGYYQDCTSYPSSQIEDFAKNIKSLILYKDWNAIAELISYPITIDGAVCEDSSDFLSLDFENHLNPEFLSAMEAETCQEMFHNWQGISMGAQSEIWFSQVYSDESNSSLLITGIHDILRQASGDALVY